jgi:DNA-directed RNA polymerase specialized sigma24 family protein
MRKYIFTQAVEYYRLPLVKLLRSKKADLDVANDVVHVTLCRMLANKSYTKIESSAVDKRTYSYMKKAVLWEFVSQMKRKTLEMKVTCSMPEDEEYPVTSFMEDEDQQTTTCPYCSQAELNQYGACSLCHTILGAGQTMRHRTRLTEIGLSYEPDLEQNTDVHTAIAKLSTLEQKLVKHIISGNSTLDDLAQLSDASRASLWRVWAEAKVKLQIDLAEYGKVRQASKTT